MRYQLDPNVSVSIFFYFGKPILVLIGKMMYELRLW